MKRNLLWTVLGLAAIVLTVTAMKAELRREPGWPGHRWHHSSPLGFVAHDLKLNEAQISQIHSIWAEERPSSLALLKELAGGMHQLADITSSGKIDEGRLQAIAAEEGSTFAKLLVEKEHLETRVYTTVLNDAQQRSADKLQQRWLDHMDHVIARLEQQNH